MYTEMKTCDEEELVVSWGELKLLSPISATGDERRGNCATQRYEVTHAKLPLSRRHSQQ